MTELLALCLDDDKKNANSASVRTDLLNKTIKNWISCLCVVIKDKKRDLQSSEVGDNS